MTESVSYSYKSDVKSNEERQQLLHDWRMRFEQNKKDNAKRLKNLKLKSEQDSSEEEKTSPFLTNPDDEDRKSPFLSNDINAERTSPFLTNEVNPDNKPFLEPLDTSEAESPLALPQTGEKEEGFTVSDITLPKNTSTIISELQRNPLRSIINPRDIANEYNISYQKALEIFKEINEDANGVAREFNLPDENATVSFLV